MNAQAGDGKRSKAEWLKLARQASGVKGLGAEYLTIENGLLKWLDLSHRDVFSVPESIGQLTTLTELDLSYSQLTSVPESIGQLTALTGLYLGENQLTSLPESIGQLTALKNLDLRSNKLHGDCPQWLSRLVNLRDLDLSSNVNLCGRLPSNLSCKLTMSGTHVGGRCSDTEWLEATGVKGLGANKLTIDDGLLIKLNLSGRGYFAVPESIGQLTTLTELDMRRNELTSVPESIGQLTALTGLYLGENQLTSLPESLGQLTALKNLDLSRNQLTSVPESIGQLTALTKLDLSSNQLISVPKSIGQLTALTELNLSKNLVTSLPECIGRLSALTRLNLWNNKLSSVPESIGQLAALNWLSLSENQLTIIPESTGQLTALVWMYLRGNQLSSVPESIGQLTALTWLSLSWNKLTSVPESIGQLKALNVLGLGENKLTSIPVSIGQLTQLQKLGLSWNNLNGEVPQWFSQLTSLKHLDISNNPDLGGSLPSLSCNVIVHHTKISSVKIKTKPLRHWWDYLFVAVHALMGYADFVTDVLSIIQLGQHGQQGLMGLNVAFLLFNVCVDTLLQPDTPSRVLAVLQLQPAVQAWETLRSGVQTEGFVRSKKVDAVCRSVPSIVLQLYGLLLTLATLGAKGVLTIGLSVTAGVVGSAMTLGSLAPKSGDGIFSRAFAVHLCYFVCELTARLVSLGLLFVAIGPMAFFLLAADFLWKLFWAWRSGGGQNLSVNLFLQALLWFGSDGIDGTGGVASGFKYFLYSGKDPGEAAIVEFLVSLGSGLTLLISLCLVNLLRTPALLVLRASKGGPVQALTALACVALFFKLLIGEDIHRTTFKQQGNEGQKETQLGGLSSHNKSSSARSGGPADPIPKRLEAPASNSGSLSVGSVKFMHDNPLRLSDAQGPPLPPPPQAHGHSHTQVSPFHRGSDAV